LLEKLGAMPLGNKGQEYQVIIFFLGLSGLEYDSTYTTLYSTHFDFLIADPSIVTYAPNFVWLPYMIINFYKRIKIFILKTP